MKTLKCYWRAETCWQTKKGNFKPGVNHVDRHLNRIKIHRRESETAEERENFFFQAKTMERLMGMWFLAFSYSYVSIFVSFAFISYVSISVSFPLYFVCLCLCLISLYFSCLYLCLIHVFCFPFILGLDSLLGWKIQAFSSLNTNQR